MGTRSLTRVWDYYKNEKTGKIKYFKLINMYRQLDGYPSGHGADLVEFLKDMDIVNGITVGDKPKKIANGMDCLAAQLVAHFKTGPGDIYLMDPHTNARGFGAEYCYDIYEAEDGGLFMEIWEGYNTKWKCVWKGSLKGADNDPIFCGI